MSLQIVSWCWFQYEIIGWAAFSSGSIAVPCLQKAALPPRTTRTLTNGRELNQYIHNKYGIVAFTSCFFVDF